MNDLRTPAASTRAAWPAPLRACARRVATGCPCRRPRSPACRPRMRRPKSRRARAAWRTERRASPDDYHRFVSSSRLSGCDGLAGRWYTEDRNRRAGPPEPWRRWAQSNSAERSCSPREPVEGRDLPRASVRRFCCPPGRSAPTMRVRSSWASRRERTGSATGVDAATVMEAVDAADGCEPRIANAPNLAAAPTAMAATATPTAMTATDVPLVFAVRGLATPAVDVDRRRAPER